jgi:serine/threonine-protein kinase
MTQQPFPFEKTGPMAAQIPPHMKTAIMRALSKDRDQRQGTAQQFYTELTAGGAHQRASATDVGVGAGPTEQFPAAGPSAGAQSPMRTQVGEPFVPPTDPGPAPFLGGSVEPTPPMMHQHVPTAGGQAVPTPPPQMHGRGGGGGKGLYIGLAGLVAALLVVGLVVALKGGGEEETEPPLLPTNTPATSDTSTNGPDPTETSETTGSTPPPTGDSSTPPPEPKTQPKPTTEPKPQPKTEPKAEPGTAACDAAIAAALAGKCAQARQAFASCSGHKRHIAGANIRNCKGR